jgi:hypothetical protein
MTTPTGIDDVIGFECSTSDVVKHTKFPLLYNVFLGLVFLTAFTVIIVCYTLVGRVVYRQGNFRKGFLNRKSSQSELEASSLMVSDPVPGTENGGRVRRGSSKKMSARVPSMSKQRGKLRDNADTSFQDKSDSLLPSSNLEGTDHPEARSSEQGVGKESSMGRVSSEGLSLSKERRSHEGPSSQTSGLPNECSRNKAGSNSTAAEFDGRGPVIQSKERKGEGLGVKSEETSFQTKTLDVGRESTSVTSQENEEDISESVGPSAMDEEASSVVDQPEGATSVVETNGHVDAEGMPMSSMKSSTGNTAKTGHKSRRKVGSFSFCLLDRYSAKLHAITFYHFPSGATDRQLCAHYTIYKLMLTTLQRFSCAFSPCTGSRGLRRENAYLKKKSRTFC